jgi:hypothetical protein
MCSRISVILQIAPKNRNAQIGVAGMPPGNRQGGRFMFF